MSQTKRTRAGYCFRLGLLPGLIFLPIVVFIAYHSVKDALEQRKVDAITEAYTAGDCKTVIADAPAILENSEYRFADQQQVKEQQEACINFTEANDSDSAGNYGEAIQQFLTVLVRTDTDTLNAKARIETILDSQAIENLLDEALCAQSALLPLRMELPDRPELPTLEFKCAEYRASLGQFPPAIANYESVIENYPDNPLATEAEAAIPILLYQQAVAVLDGENVSPFDYQSALNAVDKFLTSYPDHPQVSEAEAVIPDILYRMSLDALERSSAPENAELAITTLTRLVQDYPDYSGIEEANSTLADTLYAAANQISADAPNPDDLPPANSGLLFELYSDADNYSGLAAYDDAIAYFNQLLRDYPDYPNAPQALTTLGDTLFRGGLYAKALSDRALETLNAPTPQFGQSTVIPNVDYSRVILYMGQFVDQYAEDERATDAQTILDEAVALQEQFAGSLPTPDGIPIDGDEVIVTIYNDSPDQIRITMTGENVIFQSVPACEHCEVYSEAPVDGCREDIPRTTFTLPPGRYQVNVFSGDFNVTPYFGSWALNGGFEYPQCLYVIQRPE